MGSERDHRHATGERGTITAIRRAQQGCSKHVAVETEASVKVGNRDPDVTDTNQLRTINIAFHGDMLYAAVDALRADMRELLELIRKLIQEADSTVSDLERAKGEPGQRLPTDW